MTDNSKDDSTTLVLSLCFILCIFGGYVLAHHEIKTECRKLGKFYIGDTVFTCTVKD